MKKPFGEDLASAHEINECIARYYDEQQIYRIDHYLTKELVGNIVLVRFYQLRIWASLEQPLHR